MDPVSYSIYEHTITNITNIKNIASIFSQFLTQSRLGTRTSGTKKNSKYYASSKNNKTVVLYL